MELDPEQGDALISVGHLLEVVVVADERVVVNLGGAGLQEVEDDLAVFRVVLVPGVIASLAGAGDRDGGDHTEAEALEVKEVSERAVIIARGFKAYGARRAASVEESRQALEVSQCRVDLQVLAHTGRE
jgi:hypothetical protein